MNVLQFALLTSLRILVGQALFCEECWNPNQEKAKCKGWERAEGTCPGVDYIRCKPGSCVCHCKPGFFRRQDRQCTKERECWSRQMKPEQWLQNTEAMYMKYMSGYMQAYKTPPFKCFSSEYSRHNGNTFYRNVKFVMSNKGQLLPRDYKLELTLEYAPEKKDEAYLKVAAESGGKRPSDLLPKYSILYAGDYCIIISNEYPGENQRTSCTVWTTLNQFNNLHWICEYMFELHCIQPNITVSQACQCWPQQNDKHK